MKPEPHRLQQDPPEGDPALIDRELARQERKEAHGTARRQLSGQEKQPGEGPSSDGRAARQLREGAEEDTGVDVQRNPASMSIKDALDQAAPQTGTRPGP